MGLGAKTRKKISKCIWVQSVFFKYMNCMHRKSFKYCLINTQKIACNNQNTLIWRWLWSGLSDPISTAPSMCLGRVSTCTLRLSTCDQTTQDGLQTQMETMLTCLQNSQWADTGLNLVDGILNVKFHLIDYVLFLQQGHEGGGALTGKQVVRPGEPQWGCIFCINILF